MTTTDLCEHDQIFKGPHGCTACKPSNDASEKPTNVYQVAARVMREQIGLAPPGTADAFRIARTLCDQAAQLAEQPKAHDYVRALNALRELREHWREGSDFAYACDVAGQLCEQAMYPMLLVYTSDGDPVARAKLLGEANSVARALVTESDPLCQVAIKHGYSMRAARLDEWFDEQLTAFACTSDELSDLRKLVRAALNDVELFAAELAGIANVHQAAVRSRCEALGASMRDSATKVGGACTCLEAAVFGHEPNCPLNGDAELTRVADANGDEEPEHP